MTDDWVTLLRRGPEGSLWIATRNGLNRYDPASGKLERFVADPQSPRGLSSGWVSCLAFDAKRGRAFVGTVGGGGIDVLSLDSASSTPTVRISTAQGLPANSIDTCIEGTGSELWVGTVDGLARVDMETLAVTPLRRAEGAVLSGYEAAGRSDRGDLLFGGAGGFQLIQPDLLKPWTFRPPLVVTDLQVGGKRQIAGRHAQGQPVDLWPNANSLTAEFAALDYTAPERNRYAYKLEGFDEEWVEADASRRLASYTNLPPGTYRLMLLGSNRDGAFGEPTLGLVVHVHPAWYQTWWFRGALVVMALLLVGTVVQLRTRWLRARQGELERKVGLRTAELEAMHHVLREKSDMLERSSMVDPLTGLYNQRFLAGPIEHDLGASLRRAQEVRAAGGTPRDVDTIFFVIEADQLQHAHERHGAATVEQVLVQMAIQLRSVMRQPDHLLRWGETAFLAVVRETDRVRAESWLNAYGAWSTKPTRGQRMVCFCL